MGVIEIKWRGNHYKYACMNVTQNNNNELEFLIILTSIISNSCNIYFQVGIFFVKIPYCTLIDMIR
jgi:hypothetical protein